LFGAEEKGAALAIFDQAIETGEAFGYNGAEEQAFEREFAEALGGGYADGVNSGTNAVFVALGALQLEPGSEVIVPPITDPGGVMPVAVLNCVPVPADGSPYSYNISPAGILAALTPRTRAVVVAHIAGEPAELDAILELARKHNLRVVEDCAQAHGATYRGRRVGTFGDIAAFSTMSGKHLATAAQGGVVFTRDERLYWNAKRFADRGKPFGIAEPQGNVIPALNLNLNDLAAAVGRVQLRRLPAIVERRRQIVAQIAEGLWDLASVSLGALPEGAESSYWFLRLRVDASKLTVTKDRFAAAVAAEGLPVNASYRNIPVEAPWFRHAADTPSPWLYRDRVNPRLELPGAVAAVESHFNVAIHENWTEREVADLLAALAKVEAAYLQ